MESLFCSQTGYPIPRTNKGWRQVYTWLFVASPSQDVLRTGALQLVRVCVGSQATSASSPMSSACPCFRQHLCTGSRSTYLPGLLISLYSEYSETVQVGSATPKHQESEPTQPQRSCKDLGVCNRLTMGDGNAVVSGKLRFVCRNAVHVPASWLLNKSFFLGSISKAWGTRRGMRLLLLLLWWWWWWWWWVWSSSSSSWFCSSTFTIAVRGTALPESTLPT